MESYTNYNDSKSINSSASPFNQFAPTLHSQDLDALSSYPFLFDLPLEDVWSTTTPPPQPIELEKTASMSSTYSNESTYSTPSSAAEMDSLLCLLGGGDISAEPWRLFSSVESASPQMENSCLDVAYLDKQLLEAYLQSCNVSHGCDPSSHYHNSTQEWTNRVSNNPFFANNGGYTCRWKQCNAVYDDLDKLVDHLVQVHVSSGKSVYACEWANCPRSTRPFSKRHKIVTHLRTHTGERPFKCTEANCDRSFTRLDALIAHARIHTNVRPYECPEPGCKRKYFHSRSLRKHTKMHAKWNSLASSSVALTSKLCSEFLESLHQH